MRFEDAFRELPTPEEQNESYWPKDFSNMRRGGPRPYGERSAGANNRSNWWTDLSGGSSEFAQLFD
jgi:hypothetical protein